MDMIEEEMVRDRPVININKPEWAIAIGTMKNRSYWNLPNTVEFFAFFMKVIIIIPGLLFNLSWWWLYVLAFFTSTSLIWSSTKKTLPTIILLNIAWVFISITYIAKHFGLIL